MLGRTGGLSGCVWYPLRDTPPPLGPAPLLGWGWVSPACLGACPFVAQLLSSGLFLATSNEASQPNACPLVFATVIHPSAVLWEGPCALSEAGWGRDTRPGPSPLSRLLLPPQQVHLIVGQALKRYSEDRVGMVDYALESAGR